jgi:transcriptional regulator with XRE-family HTH domain/molybdate-binding protein
MTTLLALRERAGLSQLELARAAGMSRAAVGAVETGRHVPGVRAALALARVLGTTVEELFGPATPAALDVLGGVPADGEAVLACRVGDRLVSVGLDDQLVAGTQWPAADAVVREGTVELLPGADGLGVLAVGCDPALGIAAGLGARSGPPRVVAASASSARAVEALSEGRAHVAVVHGPADGLPEAPPAVRRWHLARWRVGIASAKAVSVEALCARQVPVVQREPGAAGQQAFLRAVRDVGAKPPPGPLASGHLDAVRRVTLGAPAAVAMEPAAIAAGLRFAPLEEHVAEVWVAGRFCDKAGVRALGETLASAAFRRRVGLIGGYDATASGAAA